MADKKSVTDVLVAALSLEPKEGESPTNFAYRLAQAANEMADETWEGLPTAAQKWVNSALEAVEKKEETPLPEGIEVVMSPKTEVLEGDGQEESVVTSKKSGSKKAATKAPAKSKPSGGKKVAAKSNGGSRPGPRGNFDVAAKIKLSKENPYREGTKGHDWFKKYKSGMTVEAAIAAGVPRHQVRWDVNHEHIALASK